MLFRFITAFLAGCCLLAGCATQGTRITSSVYTYLYPDQDNVIVEPTQAVLKVPVNVGIAFVPQDTARSTHNFWIGRVQPVELDAVKKQELLEKITAQFEKYEFIGRIEIIPTGYLTPGGSFENLAQVGRMHNVDVVALVSYDQIQTTNEGATSTSYWTLIGAYFIEGEKNTTTTLMDTAVFDIASHRMLFRAPGTSKVKGKTTPFDLAVELRKDSYTGFDEATNIMIKALDAKLQEFKDNIKQRPEDFKIIERQGYTGGGGAIGWFSLLPLFGFLVKHKLA